ncbi:MAG: metallophosphoesterase family protein [Nitrospiraceae bacterium]|nr:metallophosphoesterase family protein [Nitrospiraceae bacterium]
MDYAVISDVHGNIEALDAVLADISGRGGKPKRKILFLGDAVGYGPDPNACVAAIRGQVFRGVAGNHDWAVLGLTDITYFNPHARAAITWTDEILTAESRAFLEALPLVKRIERDGLFLVHGSPCEPEEWHYLLYFSEARLNFGHFKEGICLIGHSHLPFVMEQTPTGEITALRGQKDGLEAVRLKAGCRYIINAGSVGQPRDGDPRACYLLLSDEEARFVRIPYDIGATQRKMVEAGLPRPLADRLSKGL